ncbi:MAG: aminotransferase class I/II-fold pyridoxal phosphate-dependent enzyme [Clostridia bacterium]|nr:aminotransferase class I/II-fold pyridoxal phosphate-dependent enzyme [Clostridia bacterium]
MLYNSENLHGGDVYDGRVVLDFSENTNPFGTPESVKEAIRRSADLARRYPDPYCRELTKKLAAREDVDREAILFGAGAAELIYSFAEAEKPKAAVMPAPTFSEYALALERFGTKIVRFALKESEDFALTGAFAEFIRLQRPDAVFVCDPNNPTGRAAEPGVMDGILEACRETGARLFIDECFLDFTGGRSMKAFLPDHKELVILRAFTKSFGMAGVRLGYVLSSDKELLTAMSRTVQPWNVSVTAQAAGEAALGEGDFILKAAEYVRKERGLLKAELEKLGMRVFPSDANFLLFKGPIGLDRVLSELGIRIRSCSNYEGLPEGFYRTAVKLHDENKMLIAAIEDAVKEL